MLQITITHTSIISQQLSLNDSFVEWFRMLATASEISGMAVAITDLVCNRENFTDKFLHR